MRVKTCAISSPNSGTLKRDEARSASSQETLLRRTNYPFPVHVFICVYI
jgi:hypothetical protein